MKMTSTKNAMTTKPTVLKYTEAELAAACKLVGDHLARPEVQAHIKQVLDDATARIKSESK